MGSLTKISRSSVRDPADSTCARRLGFFRALALPTQPSQRFDIADVRAVFFKGRFQNERLATERLRLEDRLESGFPDLPVTDVSLGGKLDREDW